jgi:histone deacetylase complex regulatory component SIN3
LELIEEDIEPSKVESLQFPFEGPEEHTFIGTKHCYFFIRYLVTIYHRFLRAKSLSKEREAKPDEPSLYSQFLSVLVHKVKEQKGMEEYLRRIFQQDAYIFFTMDKLILGGVKLINNINVDSLTYKILRDDVKDYDLEIRKWADYQYPTVTEQLTRLYRERETLFRFSFSVAEKLIFISAWENGSTFDADKKKKDGEASIERNIFSFMIDPIYYNK